MAVDVDVLALARYFVAISGSCERRLDNAAFLFYNTPLAMERAFPGMVVGSIYSGKHMVLALFS